MAFQNLVSARLAHRIALAAALALALVLAGCASAGQASSAGVAAGSAASTSQAVSASASASSDVSSAAPEGAGESDAIDAAAYDALVSAGPVADEAAIAESAWASRVREAGVLHVGGVTTSQLFSIADERDGVVRGFDAGLRQLLCRYLLGDAGKCDLVEATPATRESLLRAGDVDIVVSTYSITRERMQSVSFAGPYFSSKFSALVRADEQGIESYEDLNGKRVAVLSGSTGPAVADEFAPDAIQVAYASAPEALEALERGEVDAYVYDFSMNAGTVLQHPDKFKVAGKLFGPDDPYGIGLPLDSDGVAFVNGFLEQIESDGTWEKLWKICIGDRLGVEEAPEPPTVGDLSFVDL